jgi:hypothetical protein
MVNLLSYTIALVAATLVYSHPGESEDSLRADLEARNSYIASLENNNFANCVPKLNKRSESGQNEYQAIAKRRVEKVKSLRRELGLAEDGTRVPASK